MIRIVLNDEQVAQLNDSAEPIELVDRFGRTVRSLKSAPKADSADAYLDEIQRRMKNDDGVRYTTQEVLEHLHSLDAE